MIDGATRTAAPGTAPITCCHWWRHRRSMVPVVGGRMTLGTWQSIALLDTNGDNARGEPCGWRFSLAEDR